VDAAMVDGATSLMAMFYELRAIGVWEGARGSNLLDGGAPFYSVYATADGKYMAVAALEPQFYGELLEMLGLDSATLPQQYDQSGWSDLRQQFAAVFATRTRAQWAEIFAGSDACVTPVLSIGETTADAHLAARGSLIDVGGEVQPAPAPRFSRSVVGSPTPAPSPGEQTVEVLQELGLTAARISELRATGAVL